MTVREWFRTLRRHEWEEHPSRLRRIQEVIAQPDLSWHWVERFGWVRGPADIEREKVLQRLAQDMNRSWQ